MSSLQAVEHGPPLFPYSKWTSQLPHLAGRYRWNRPYPHIHLEGFLAPDVARHMAREFPDRYSDAWIRYKHHNENKLGLPNRELFPWILRAVTDELNSPEFLSWLSVLTGIAGLIADPSLEGGGLHQSGRGGFLNVHTDFSMHHYQKNWRRRVNLILYLNEGWRPEWGGAIELWDSNMRRCEANVLPLLNHVLIFNTDDKSFHGFPEPLTCPEAVSRKSLALYYYTVETGTRTPSRSTNYRARPADTRFETVLIWLDKQAVDVYSKLKTRFGLSDSFASKLLGLLSGRK